MRKKYLQLTSDQKSRGVIFSSQLQPGGATHEVFKGQDDQAGHVRRLKDDSFFNGSPFKINEIRE